MTTDVFLGRVLVLDLVLIALMLCLLGYQIFITPRGGKFQRLSSDGVRFFVTAMLMLLAWCLVALACYQWNLINC